MPDQKIHLQNMQNPRSYLEPEALQCQLILPMTHWTSECFDSFPQLLKMIRSPSIIHNFKVRSIAILIATSITSPPVAHAQDPAPNAEFRNSYGIEDFYTQLILVEGFPILASSKVMPAALEEAAHNIRGMLKERPDILRALTANKIRFGIMATSERTCDLPEHSMLQPRAYWNRRARGLGATRDAPCVSCGEENLLNYPGDQYSTESILVHEFAHAIHEMALNDLDPSFDARLREAYDAAMQAGRWHGLYAAQNRQEYWAEGVQSWFDANRENDAIHNHVNSRKELIEYDPALAALCKEVFGDNNWRYVRSDHPSRKGELHLKSLDRSKLKPFAWSKEEQAAFDALDKNRE